MVEHRTTKTSTKLVAVACLAGLLAAQDHKQSASQPPRGKGCEIEMIDPALVTREMLLARTAPLIIRGGAADWPALERWDKDRLRAEHGGDIFRADPWNANVTLGAILDGPRDRYFMGHLLTEGGCYDSVYRQYSPTLEDLADDYKIPAWGRPMSNSQVIQMGVGSGRTIGVPPEHHPSSWFALVFGRKRWALRPPVGYDPLVQNVSAHIWYEQNVFTDSEKQKEQQKEPGERLPEDVPGHVIQNDCLIVDDVPEGVLLCDQQPGDIMWTPSWWWHETCALEEYSIGLGAVTWDESSGAEFDLARIDQVCGDKRNPTTGPFKLENASDPALGAGEPVLTVWHEAWDGTQLSNKHTGSDERWSVERIDERLADEMDEEEERQEEDEL